MLTNILRVSLSVSPVILLFLLLTKRMQKRFQPKLKYWLWLILALRLVVPFSVTLPERASNLPIVGTVASVGVTEKADTPQRAADAEIQTNSSVQTVSNAVDAVPQTAKDNGSAGKAAGTSPVSDSSVKTAAPMGNPTEEPEPETSVNWRFVLTVVYWVGVGLFVLYYFTAYLHLRRKIRRWGYTPKRDSLNQQLAMLARKAGVKKPVRLLVVETVHTPMVVGFFRPILVLPWEDWEPGTLRNVLAHELIHIRRRDLLYKLVLLAANALHWFNPLVWLMRSRADQDLEICCDAEALRNASSQARRQYSETILTVAGQTLRRETSVTTAFGSTKKSIMERFTEIYRKGARRQGMILLLAVILVAALAGCRISAVGLSAGEVEGAAETEAAETVSPEPSPEITPEEGSDPSGSSAALSAETLEAKFADAVYSDEIPENVLADMKNWMLEPGHEQLWERCKDGVWNFYKQDENLYYVNCYANEQAEDGLYVYYTLGWYNGSIIDLTDHSDCLTELYLHRSHEEETAEEERREAVEEKLKNAAGADTVDDNIRSQFYIYLISRTNIDFWNTCKEWNWQLESGEDGAVCLCATDPETGAVRSLRYTEDTGVNPAVSETTSAPAALSDEFPDTLADYTTECDAGSSTGAWVNNITLACAAIDGTVLQPGETFSFNDVVGERTAEKGYREAPVYPSGDTVPAFGGGISHVSSTLYICALYADLEIVERWSHTYCPNYVSGGMDAAVYWGKEDFRFKNNTDHPLRINASVMGTQCSFSLKGTDTEHHTVELAVQKSVNVSVQTMDGPKQISNPNETYLLTRYVYDGEGNLVRTDTTADLDEMGGLGTSVYTFAG